MKKNYFWLLLTLFVFTAREGFSQSPICDSLGNLVIYSNYDGGVLNINVDQNIPNLLIGVVTYEPVTVNITGTYAGNVAGVRYAGYVSTNNMHCNNSPTTTTITGVPSNLDTVLFLPAATYSNPNGYSSIVCNYSCSTTTNQGGCNTADQVAHYFTTTMGGTFRYHFTQYGCWNTSPYNISAGGNCCVNPTSLAVFNGSQLSNTEIFTANDQLHIQLPRYLTGDVKMQLLNLRGESLWSVNRYILGGNEEITSLESLPNGLYLLQIVAGDQAFAKKVLVVH